MFYAYRLNKLENWKRAMVRLDDPRVKFSPDFSLQAFLKLIKNIGWDGTWTGHAYQFAIPFHPMFLECCAIQEGTTGRWFIGTPVALTYLNDICDWDGQTDSEEVKRTIADIENVDHRPQVPKTRLTRPWALNQKGTLTASIEGLNVCVLKAKYGTGYFGVIFGAGEKKVTTPTLTTETAVQSYLLQNFRGLTKEWQYVDPDEDTSDDEDEIPIFRPLG